MATSLYDILHGAPVLDPTEPDNDAVMDWDELDARTNRERLADWLEDTGNRFGHYVSRRYARLVRAVRGRP